MLLNIFFIVTAVVSLATTITNTTKTKKDDAIMNKYILPAIAVFSVLGARTEQGKGELKLPIIGDIIGAIKGTKKAK